MQDFQAGTTAPPFHVFCRSCTCPYFDDEFSQEDMRAARGEDGETYYVPGDMTYPEWKEKFVDGGDKDGVLTTLDFMRASEADTFSYTIPNAGTMQFRASKITDSKYPLYADGSVDEETVAFFESKLEQAVKNAPEDFVMPERIILTSMGENIAGGYMQATDNLFLNSLMDTDEKILEFVNRNEGLFANTTATGPVLHELGHKFNNTWKQVLSSRRAVRTFLFTATFLGNEAIYRLCANNASFLKEFSVLCPFSDNIALLSSCQITSNIQCILSIFQ